VVEHLAEPFPLLATEVLGTGQQEPAVDPDRGGDGATAAEQAPGDVLPNLGEHLVRQGDQMPLVDRDQRVRQRGPDTRGVRRRRIDHHDLNRGPERWRLLGQPVLGAAVGAARSQPQLRSPVVGAVHNEVSHGSERIQVPSRIQRTDRKRVSSMPSLLVGSGSGSHRAAAATKALCAVGQDTRYSPATSETARFPEAIA
jgi:hypothetical protein